MQIVHDSAAGATETADCTSRSRDERNNSTTGETVGGEREGSDERQDFEDTWDQGRQTQRDAAEQHEKVYGGAQSRSDDTE